MGRHRFRRCPENCAADPVATFGACCAPCNALTNAVWDISNASTVYSRVIWCDAMMPTMETRELTTTSHLGHFTTMINAQAVCF